MPQLDDIMAKDKTTIKVDVIPEYKVPKGHMPHRSGAGLHKDKRTKRKRTRATQQKDSIGDFES